MGIHYVIWILVIKPYKKAINSVHISRNILYIIILFSHLPQNHKCFLHIMSNNTTTKLWSFLITTRRGERVKGNRHPQLSAEGGYRLPLEWMPWITVHPCTSGGLPWSHLDSFLSGQNGCKYTNNKFKSDLNNRNWLFSIFLSSKFALLGVIDEKSSLA